MTGDVEIERFLFAFELVAGGPFRNVVQSLSARGRVAAGAFERLEQAALAMTAVLLDRARGAQSARQGFPELRAVSAETIEGAGHDQFLDGRPRDDLQIDAFAEIKQVLEGPVLQIGRASCRERV